MVSLIRCGRCLVAALALLACVGAGAQPAGDEAARTIHALVAQPAQEAWRPGAPYDPSGWLDRFYAARGYRPAWDAGQAAIALGLLRAAGDEGLDPRDYDAAGLEWRWRARQGDPAQWDVALTAAVLHYLADLRIGRVRSEYHGARSDERLRAFDPVERLRDALERDSLARTALAATPSIPLYARTRDALARYRELLREDLAPLPLPAGGKVAAGGPYAAADLLRERLVLLGDLLPEPLLLLGDLAPHGPEASDTYTHVLARGVRRFQARHGLQSDGILGRGTIAALNVPIARRVRQLELTLERLRWLPELAGGPVIAVNLPAYRLWAFSGEPGETPLEMRVVVGSAVASPTPLFVGRMRYLEFNPYWNVTRGITVREIIPNLRRNPDYLAQHDMEVLGVAPGTGTAGVIRALQENKARVRQRPGPNNALGAVKFAMPNAMDIYLHSTPMREAFRRTRRDLSHGCIRIEQPAALAQFVLADQPEWDADAIQLALQPGPTRRVELRRPIPVVLFYATAVVERDGTVLFSQDIYGRDVKLERALAPHVH